MTCTASAAVFLWKRKRQDDQPVLRGRHKIRWKDKVGRSRKFQSYAVVSLYIAVKEFLRKCHNCHLVVNSRRPVPSTDQAPPSCFYFRVSWILMEQHFFFIFLSPRVSAGPQKPQTLTASKTKYENFGPKIWIPH